MLLDIWFLERDNPGVERAAEAENHALDGECTTFGQSLAEQTRFRHVPLDRSEASGQC